ncbi:hypothetical protein EYZ11_013363 [Aspergillus tanneri]|uniref:Uncharacterized protein n=1 Tax=Aspergillus tanneri TaxID=1220188 RepID=A0A4S3J399_9EURO|nr:hypothetical protein EYZ11_013363 [Aspergillus tanneri]
MTSSPRSPTALYDRPPSITCSPLLWVSEGFTDLEQTEGGQPVPKWTAPYLIFTYIAFGRAERVSIGII